MLVAILAKAVMLRNKHNQVFYNRDFLYIFVTIIITILYLIHTVKWKHYFTASYFTTISIFLTLGVIILDGLKHRIKYIIGSFILLTNLFLNWHSTFLSSAKEEFDFDNLSWNAYYVKKKNDTINSQLEIQKLLKERIKDPKFRKAELKVLRHFRTPPPYSILRENVSEDLIYFHPLKSFKDSYDVIGFNRRSVAFMTEEEFKDFVQLSSPNIAKIYIEHREDIQKFLKEQTFNGNSYRVILDRDNILFYAKE